MLFAFNPHRHKFGHLDQIRTDIIPHPECGAITKLGDKMKNKMEFTFVLRLGG